MDEIQYASERDRAIQEVDRESILLRQVIAALLASVAHQMRDLPTRESERLARLTAADGGRKCGCLGALEIGLRTLQNRIAAPRAEAKATTSGA
jgi:hypothetical protein